MAVDRSVAGVRADIAATRSRLRALDVELRQAMIDRNRRIVLDILAGMSRPEVGAKHGVKYQTIENVLFHHRLQQDTLRIRKIQSTTQP